MLCVIAAGCAHRGEVVRRDHGMPLGHAGSSSALVFDEPGLAELRWMPRELTPEYGRRDAALAYRQPRAIRSLDSWPTSARPTIERARYLFLPRGSDRFIYFSRRER